MTKKEQHLSDAISTWEASCVSMASALEKFRSSMAAACAQFQHVIDRKDGRSFHEHWLKLTDDSEYKDHITNWRVINEPRSSNLDNHCMADDMWISLYVSPPRSEWMSPDVDPKFFIQLVKINQSILPGPFEVREDGFYDQDEKSANYAINKYLIGYTHIRDVFEKCRQTINEMLQGDYTKEEA